MRHGVSWIYLVWWGVGGDGVGEDDEQQRKGVVWERAWRVLQLPREPDREVEETWGR